jgi:hypothetical protein
MYRDKVTKKAVNLIKTNTKQKKAEIQTKKIDRE